MELPIPGRRIRGCFASLSLRFIERLAPFVTLRSVADATPRPAGLGGSARRHPPRRKRVLPPTIAVESLLGAAAWVVARSRVLHSL